MEQIILVKFAAALNFEANLPNILPENTNTDLGALLTLGVYGVLIMTTV